MNQQEFIDQVIRIAQSNGFKIETNRSNQLQIDFGHKKLHSEHLGHLFPEILYQNADVSALIEEVAPGRPCTHKPMREIVAQLTKDVV